MCIEVCKIGVKCVRKKSQRECFNITNTLMIITSQSIPDQCCQNYRFICISSRLLSVFRLKLPPISISLKNHNIFGKIIKFCINAYVCCHEYCAETLCQRFVYFLNFLTSCGCITQFYNGFERLGVKCYEFSMVQSQFKSHGFHGPYKIKSWDVVCA